MRDDGENERGARRAVATSRSGRLSARSMPARAELELVTERTGVLGYRYRRIRIEQLGRRANVKEIRLQLDYDLQFELATKRRDLVKVRGRRIDGPELEAIWTTLGRARPLRLPDHYDFLDSVNPDEIDETIGADGEPIAVSTGEEGPTCLTLRWDQQDGTVQQKRILIERFREPDVDACEPRQARRAPLAAICALVDNKVKATRGLNYRKTDMFQTLLDEFGGLKARDFLNLRQFERRAVEALGALQDARAVPSIAAELFAPDSRVRLQALDALATIGHPSAVPEVELLFYDDETSVRDKARRVLKGLRAK
jgi:hypothetical protein